MCMNSHVSFNSNSHCFSYRQAESQKLGMNRQMYSRLGSHSNPESPQIMRPSPPLQRPSSNTIGNINRGNINQNAIVRDPTPTGFLKNHSDSQLVQRNDSRLMQRNDSAELHRRRTPVQERNITADNYMQNLNLHHDYQGRRGRMRVNNMLEETPVRYLLIFWFQ